MAPLIVTYNLFIRYTYSILKMLIYSLEIHYKHTCRPYTSVSCLCTAISNSQMLCYSIKYVLVFNMYVHTGHFCMGVFKGAYHKIFFFFFLFRSLNWKEMFC